MSDYQGTYTTNLNLSKDSVDDSYDVERVNSNSDKIDKWAGEVNTSLKDLANPNLFINGDFRNPVNTKGKTIYNRANLDNIDMWNFYSEKIENDVTLKLVDGGITIQNSTSTSQGGIFQNINCVIEDGSTLTFSAYVDGEVRTLTGVYGSTPIVEVKDGFKIGFAKINNVLQGVLYSWDDKLHTIKWVKLELGDKSTPLYPKTYVEELQNCLMYNGNELTTPYSNPNLLINGDFQVWQRGNTFDVPYNLYTTDRWHCNHTGSTIYTISKNDNGLMLNTVGGNAYLNQFIENSSNLKNEICTLSVSIEGNVFSVTGKSIDTPSINTSYGAMNFRYDTSKDLIIVTIRIDDGHSVVINWVKLELGSKATPFVPRPYGEELALCQRYYEEVPAGQQVLGVKDNVNAFIYWNFIVEKRINPTVSFTHPGYDNNHVNAYSNNIELANTPVEIEWTNKRTARMKIPALSSVPIGSAISAFGAITIDAEIY